MGLDGKTVLGRYCVLGTCWYQEATVSNRREVKHFSPGKKFIDVPLTKSNAISKFQNVINMDTHLQCVTTPH